MNNYTRGIFHYGIASAIALGAGLGPAAATLIQSLPTQHFSASNSVTDNLTTAGPTTSAPNYGPAKNFSQFDTTTGVLTGAKLKLSNSVRTKSGSLSASGGTTGTSRTAAGINSDTDANITAPGAESITLGTFLGPSLSCSTSTASCSANPPSAALSPVAASHTVASGSLSLYAGAGTVSLQPSADLSAEAKNNGGSHPFATISDTYTLAWSGDLGIDYSYVYHAIPSFDAIDPLNPLTALLIDFGTVLQNSGSGQLQNGFSIYNLISHSDAPNTSDVKLSAINGTGSSGTLSSDISQFGGLSAGASSLFDVFFDTTVLGNFQSIYNFTLNDDIDGVGVDSHNMQLTLQGNVIPDPVPEPGSLALLGSGLLAAGAMARRRKTAKATSPQSPD